MSGEGGKGKRDRFVGINKIDDNWGPIQFVSDVIKFPTETMYFKFKTE